MKKKITLSIIIPVYNEEGRLASSFSVLEKYSPPSFIDLKKIIFVNDGSMDNTLEVLRKFAQSRKNNSKVKIEIITYKRNKGRGYAVRKGLLATNTEYSLYLDADFSMPLKNLIKIKPQLLKGFDLIVGSKKKPGAIAIPQRPLIRQIVGYGHSIFASLVLGVFVWDFQGGFKIMSKRFISEVVSGCTQDRWGLDMEIIFFAKKLGYKFFEFPATWTAIEEGTTVKLAQDSKRALKDMFSIKAKWNESRRENSSEYSASPSFN